MNYIVLDIETTGLSKYRHNITEIAAIKFDGENILGQFQTLINPERNIPSEITKLTGITNDMIKTAPKFCEIIPQFLDFIQNNTIVAHNATFDYGFISENIYKHTGNWIQNPCLCTKKLSNRLLPNLPRKNLGSLCDYYGLTNECAHRAMGDTQVTVEIFKNLLKLLKNKGIIELNEIIDFQNKKISECI